MHTQVCSTGGQKLDVEIVNKEEVRWNGVPAEVAAARRPFYRPELDGLRFYAFLGVFVCHALPIEPAFYSQLHLPLPRLWSAICLAGAAGVDLFFVLSAFLITSLLLRERQDTGRISLRRFYIRRMLRIWPLYFLVLALGILFATMAATRKHLWYYTQSLPWYYVAGYLLFVSNWIYAVHGTAQSICAPLWTVSIEEQFYLVWPMVAKRLNRRGIVIAGTTTFVVATLSEMAIALGGGNSSYLYFGSAAHCDSLALGILLALSTDFLPKLQSNGRLLLVSGGLAAWVASAAWLCDTKPGPASIRLVLGRLVISVASSAILYGCLYSSSKLLRGSWVVRLGKVSYGLYMWHFTGLLIALSLFRPERGWKLLATKLLGLLLTWLLASASYQWMESPFLRLKSRFATVSSRPV